MQLFIMLEKIITRGLYTQDDMLQKLDVFYLVGTLTDQEYNTLYNMICPPVQDESPIEDEVIDEQVQDEVQTPENEPEIDEPVVEDEAVKEEIVEGSIEESEIQE